MKLTGVYDTFNKRWSGQTAWIISDTHFGDKELRAGFPDRPTDEELVKMINSCAGRTDVLILLGDVGDIKYIQQLRAGYKILICGNHDLGASRYKKEIDLRTYNSELTSEEVVKKITEDFSKYSKEIIGNSFIYKSHDSWHCYVDNNLFDEVYTGPLMIGEKLLLSHEPVDVSWAYNIHGHDHEGKMRTNHLNVCADVVGYRPVNLNSFLSKSGALSKVETLHRQTIDKATRKKNVFK